MTGQKWTAMRERRPEAWALFEEYNDITMEDVNAWDSLAGQCRTTLAAYGGDMETKTALLDVIDELEAIAERRRGRGTDNGCKASRI